MTHNRITRSDYTCEDVLMYDGCRVTVELEVEIAYCRDQGDRWTPPSLEAYLNDYEIELIDAFDENDLPVVIDPRDKLDPYVQSVAQHVDGFADDIIGELIQSIDFDDVERCDDDLF